MYKIIVTCFLCILVSEVIALDNPSALELSQKYAQTQNKINSSFISKEKTESKASYDIKVTKLKANDVVSYSLKETRWDGERMKIIKNGWGWQNPRMTRKENYKTHVSWLFDNDKFISYSNGLVNDKFVDGYPGGGSIGTGYAKGKEKVKKMIQTQPFMGYLVPGMRLDEFILKDKDASVHKEMQKVGDNKCYVITCRPQTGVVIKVWIDPKHGYNMAKYECKYGEGYRAEPRSKSFDADDVVYKNGIIDRFMKVGDAWVPMGITTKSKIVYGGKTSQITERRHERSEFIINPDHDAMGSFLADDIQNGAKMFLDNVTYLWQDGELVGRVDEAVVDQIDKMMDEVLAESDNKSSKKEFDFLEIKGNLTKFNQMQNISSLYFQGVKTVNGVHPKTVRSQYATDGRQIGFKVTSKEQGINAYVWDGKKTIHYLKLPAKRNVTASGDKKKIYSLLSEHYPGAGLLGYFNGQDERIDRLLSKALKKASFSKVKLNGENCNLIEAQIDQHKYRVWFSPANGSNIIKAEIKQNSKIVYLLDQVQFKKFEDVWVPVSCTVMDSTGMYTYERTKIDLKPDLVKLKAFALPVSNGTPVNVEKQNGDFIWSNNNILDKEGNIVY